MEYKNQPLVSIGVPVFNGEKGLERALDSLLRQDYANLEIIISDNGSTDATPKICAQFVLKDPRVRYYQAEKNFGAAWNFNRVFELSSGKYFMWAAHDDWRESSFVSVCVEKMERCPDAALCQTYMAIFMEGRKEMLYVSSLNSFEGLVGLMQRYRETLKHFSAIAIYGLYRSSAMRKTKMWKKSMSTDLAFIQELSIHGEFVQVPQILFNYFGRKKWNTVHQDYSPYYEKKKKPWWYLPFIALFCNHLSRVSGASVPFFVKLRLWCILIEHEIARVNLKVLIKVSGLFFPKRWKEKLGCAIYWRWMHNPNMQVGCKDLFLERVVKPKLGWWR